MIGEAKQLKLQCRLHCDGITEANREFAGKEQEKECEGKEK